MVKCENGFTHVFDGQPNIYIYIYTYYIYDQKLKNIKNNLYNLTKNLNQKHKTSYWDCLYLCDISYNGTKKIE